MVCAGLEDERTRVAGQVTAFRFHDTGSRDEWWIKADANVPIL